MPKTSWSGHRHRSHADCSRRSRYHRGIIGPNKPKLLNYLTSIKREITEIYGEIFIFFVRIAYHHIPTYHIPTYRVHIILVGFGERERIMRARRAGGPRLLLSFWSAHVAIDSAYRVRLSRDVVVAVRSSRLEYRGGHTTLAVIITCIYT